MILTEPLARAATRPSTIAERRCAFAVAALLTGYAVVWSLSGRAGLSYSPQFFASYVTALTLSALFVAMLLVFRAGLVRDRSSALVAAAFVYCVPLIAGYAITFPGVGPAWIARPEASGWMSFAWRIGFPMAIVWYAVRPPSSTGTLARSIVVAIGCSATVIVLALAGALPRLYHPGDGAYLPALFAANLVQAGISLLALIALWRKRPSTMLDAWLAAAVSVLMTGGILILFTHARLSAAADAVRITNLATSLIVACAPCSEFRQLLIRSTALDRYLAMAQFSGSIVYLLDADRSCIYVNRRWTEVTGQPAHEALGSGWRATVHPDDLAVSAEAWETALRMRRPHEVELRYRCAYGSYRWHLATATPTFDADGKLDGWYGSAMDIDAQRRQADQLEELYAREHEIAQTLQTAFIPPFLPHVDGVDFRAVYRPALRETEVGGDWYDAFVLPDGRVAISVGDVAGHGIDAAIAMVRLRETLRAVTSSIDADPGALLQMADRAFMASHPDVIATAAFAVYDPRTRQLVCARAGHPPPVLVRDGVARFLETPPGLPLGVAADSTFVAETFVLEPGDRLALYTDGLLEAERNIVAGELRFRELLERFPTDMERLVEEALQGCQRDDVALLHLEIRALPALPSWHFNSDDAASAGDARFAFVAHLKRRGIHPDVVATAELVFGELVSNVVRHAPGPIEVELTDRSNVLSLAVRDRGPQFVQRAIALPDDPLSECGRGLYLMSCLGSTPAVVPRRGGGNEVIVAFAAQRRPDPALGNRDGEIALQHLHSEATV